MLHRFEYAFATFGLFYMSGALTALLTPEMVVDGSPAVRAIGIVIGVIAVLLLLSVPRALNRAMLWYWPILVPPVLAVLSNAWSIDPDLGLRRAGSLVLTTAFAFWLAERFSLRTVMKILLVALAMVCVLSFLAIVLSPSFGVHQQTDVKAAVHAGAWRGLYPHKNDFGRVAALTGVLFLLAGLTNPERRRWLFALAALAAVLVWGAQSSQAVVLIVLPTLMALFALRLRRMKPRARAVAVALMLPIGVALYVGASAAFGEILLLLGRDATLSGRTDIWAAALTGLPAQYYLLGGGYGVGWGLVIDNVTMATGDNIGHAHNGYLDLFVDLGFVGLIATVVAVVHVTSRATRAVLAGRDFESAILGLAFVMFFVLGNIAASFLLLYNSIYWVVLVVFYCAFKRDQRIRAADKPPSVRAPQRYAVQTTKPSEVGP